MYICVLTEPFFRNGSWCIRVLSGLNEVLKAKKLDARFPERLDDISPSDSGDSEKFLIIIGCNPGWIYAAVQRAAETGMHPVLLCCQPVTRLPCVCSCVSSEPQEATDYILRSLREDGRHTPALYGCNPESYSDLARKECFLSNPVFRVSENDIFYNAGSLSKCFSHFAEKAGHYDSVICVNSYAALHLVRNLRTGNIGSDIRITAFGDTMLTRRFCPELDTVSAQYEEFGRAALAVCKLLSGNPELDAVSVTVKWKISSGVRTGLPPASFADSPPVTPTADEQFYHDSELSDMLKLENMLNSCGETELRILDLALAGESNEAIAAKCFLSENTVKYHIKKLRTMCGCKTKEELLRRLRDYTANAT